MSAEYAERDLPDEKIVVNNHIWRRENLDTDSYQWVRELDESEYDWDPSEIDLVGAEVPICVVSVRYSGSEWQVQCAETAGPDYHRPGFTELIGSEYHATVNDAKEAFDKVRTFIEQLS